MTGMDGSLGPKVVYASLFAGSIRRTEDFWAQCIPAKGIPRVAIYLSRNDILLANDPHNEWGFPDNDPLNVYTALRDQGYWVDVLPHTKLNTDFLKQYDALILVGARHLTKENCTTITDYAQSGGVLVGDVLSGYYDEHHRVTGGLEKVFGVQTGELRNWDNWNLLLSDGIMRCYQSAPVKAAGAEICAVDHRNEPAVFKQKVGKGQAIYIAGILGGLQNNVPQGYDLLGPWLAHQLKQAGVNPAYRPKDNSTSFRRIRIESPWIDSRGNMGLTVGTMGIENQPSLSVVMNLPKGIWKNALWASSDKSQLSNVPIKHLKANEYIVDLPAFKAAGMLLFFHNHDPLLTIQTPEMKNVGIETPIPIIPAGEPTAIKVRIFNASDAKCSAGNIRLLALKGWNVSPDLVKTPPVSAHGAYEATFKVTAPDCGLLPARERMYPLVARWSDGKADRAVNFTTVGISMNESALPKLLSDNVWLPDESERKIKTGTTYRYVIENVGSDEKSVIDPSYSETNAPTPALQNGLGNWDKSARINSNDILVEFDLKKIYKIAVLKYHSSPVCPVPKSVEYFLSSDGTNYTSVGTFIGDGSLTWGKWFSLPLSDISARFIRLKVTFDTGSVNFMDEVEIWGR